MWHAACIDIAKLLALAKQIVQEGPCDDGKLFASRVHGIPVALERESLYVEDVEFSRCIVQHQDVRRQHGYSEPGDGG